jgi:hypothetical protein|tara:strand:- start:357 stop:599 length:243 start_codon:yes stop_codon:yes gene_type:complete
MFWSKEKKLTKQQQRLLDYLYEHKTINPLQSWQKLGIYRLSAVKYDLVKAGYNIETNRKSVNNRFGEKCSFAEYKLERAS